MMRISEINCRRAGKWKWYRPMRGNKIISIIGLFGMSGWARRRRGALYGGGNKARANILYQRAASSA